MCATKCEDHKLHGGRGVVLIVSIFIPCNSKREAIDEDLKVIRDVLDSFEEMTLGGGI